MGKTEETWQAMRKCRYGESKRRGRGKLAAEGKLSKVVKKLSKVQGENEGNVRGSCDLCGQGGGSLHSFESDSSCVFKLVFNTLVFTVLTDLPKFACLRNLEFYGSTFRP